jgi:hypothetical protein
MSVSSDTLFPISPIRRGKEANCGTGRPGKIKAPHPTLTDTCTPELEEANRMIRLLAQLPALRGEALISRGCNGREEKWQATDTCSTASVIAMKATCADPGMAELDEESRTRRPLKHIIITNWCTVCTRQGCISN